MQMENALTCVRADIGQKAVALFQTQLMGHIFGGREYAGQKRTIRGGQLGH
ncbi:hypothetical protein KDAU_12970 [Dictyobacter aurantiacus]|uniref:Uncharacterized protein n=1 Tax=Dictyobacter aurantiacus TaxID=1936993 RepID=A0A401ZB60_9CHLR|nr:hypothetical protein KDAU_12970 [Dictyobacter aurantiacus]